MLLQLSGKAPNINFNISLWFDLTGKPMIYHNDLTRKPMIYHNDLTRKPMIYHTRWEPTNNYNVEYEDKISTCQCLGAEAALRSKNKD
jgi:hypothetical protein